jgi:hypothetical protein
VRRDAVLAESTAATATAAAPTPGPEPWTLHRGGQ